MRTGLIAYKMGMTRVFDEVGRHVPVSVLKVDGCVVLRVKDGGKDGYTAVQLGAGAAREKRVSKPVRGAIAKSGLNVLPKDIKEFRVSGDCLLSVGDVLLPSHFVRGQFVDVQGRSTGKGFQGGMKRWNFRGLEASHGVSVSHRSLGGTGQRQDPGKVFKGKKMPGHLGDETITIQNLVVVEANDADGYILVKGAVPGVDGAALYIYDAVKRALPKDAPMPAGVKSAKSGAKPEAVPAGAPVPAAEENLAAAEPVVPAAGPAPEAGE